MKKLGIFVALGIIWGSFTLSPIAQSGLSIVAPANGVKLAAGPDYATDVLGDPWDMSNIEDLGSDPAERVGWSSDFAVANGRAGGTTVKTPSGANDTNLVFLYRGFHNIVNPGRSGKRFPVDSTFYKKLSYKMYSGIAGQVPQVYWFHNPWDHPSGLGYGVRFLPVTQSGNKLYSVNLNESLAAGSAWTNGNVKGFRLDPNGTATGHQVFYDWVRVTKGDSETSSIMPVQWSGGSGSTSIDVIDSSNAVMNVATGVSGSSYSFNYGVLPPGSYTLRITRGSSVATRTFSVNNPPIISVTDPDETGGTDDYATTVVNNAWDMNASGDVQMTPNVSGGSFSGGAFHGTNTNGDPMIFLLTQSNNQNPINTQRYRYLTYRLRVDGAYSLALGSVARVFWGSQASSVAANMTATQDIVIWPGTNSYTVDLASLHFGTDGALESNSGAHQLWTAASIKHFRLDPHEFYNQTRAFHLEDVRLTAMDEGFDSFRIRWSGSDADGDASTVALYYDTNTNPGDGRTLITQGVALSAGQFDWNAANVTPGVYWIYAVASDGLDARGFYSTGQVRIMDGAAVPTSDPVSTMDTPTNGASVTQPFTLSGWAIDRGASTGTGVNAVEVYAQPLAGGNQIALGAATYGLERPGVAAAYGSRFTNSGFAKSISTLSPGAYQLIAMARSTVTGTFSITETVNVTVQAAASGGTSNPLLYIDNPRPNVQVTQPFNVSGWAVDRGSSTGTGVNAVEVLAKRSTSSTTVNLGAASYGGTRNDVGNMLGSRFTNSGYMKSVTGLSAGSYTLTVRARSTVTGTYSITKTVNVTVLAAATVPTAPWVQIDTPGNGATISTSLSISGWAIDRESTSGPGMDEVRVYRRTTQTGANTLIGVANYGGARPDVAAAFGNNRFLNSGYTLNATIPTGDYYLAVSARSTRTGLWTDNVRLVHVR